MLLGVVCFDTVRGEAMVGFYLLCGAREWICGGGVWTLSEHVWIWVDYAVLLRNWCRWRWTGGDARCT